MQQILQAVRYLHGKNLLHGDLKPENILIDTELDDSMKLIDFGFSSLCE